MIEIAILCLFTFAALLFILSLFRKDKTVELENQIEQMSITYMQEIYQLKRKVRYLEEELLISAEQSNSLRQNHLNSHKKLLEEIFDLYERGFDIHAIASKTRLSPDEVNHLLESNSQPNGFRGIKEDGL
jgi:hypothetical protein